MRTVRFLYPPYVRLLATPVHLFATPVHEDAVLRVPVEPFFELVTAVLSGGTRRSGDPNFWAAAGSFSVIVCTAEVGSPRFKRVAHCSPLAQA